MFLINKLEELTRLVVDGVGQIQLGPVQLVDSGDGQTLPRFAAAYPQAVATVLRALAETTGVDVTALLAPPTRSEMTASAAGATSVGGES
jgi:short-subunit dehydrogenase